jgi:uncharacterized protein (TIGR00369 family)
MDREDPGGGVAPEYLDYLRNAFLEVPLHKLLDFRFVEMEAGQVVVEMPVRPEAFNGSGNLHGGALATLIDVAAGSCAARASGFDPMTQSLVTADLHVRYLGRPKTDLVRAEARLMRAGRMLIVVEVRVVDLEENLVAFADFSSMIVGRREPLQRGAATDHGAPDL